MQLSMLVVLLLGYIELCHIARAQPTVKVGALLATETIIGKVCKTAIELAVEDVNSSRNVLNSTVFYIDIRNSTENAVLGSYEALKILRNNTMAIVGPQTSSVAEFVADLADKANVPMLTFAATDPSLSMHRHPFFLRISQSNTVQMQAVADLVHHFNWRKIMVIYTDDDFGQGAIPPLNQALSKVQIKIDHLIPIPRSSDAQTIKSALLNITLSESRVIVVHALPDSGELLFSVAKSLGMLNADYVWILTNSLANIIDSFSSSTLDSMQGILGLKINFPHLDRPSFQSIMTRWKSRYKEENPKLGNQNVMNVYGLLAYDAVWGIALSIDNFLQKESWENLTFSKETYPSESFNVDVFRGGQGLKEEILKQRFTGFSGEIALSKEGEPMNCTFDLVNVAHGKSKLVGIWNRNFGFSRIEDITWPHGSNGVPRGWKIPSAAKRVLRIGVPYDPSFDEMVIVKKSQGNPSKLNITGFSIDVFEAVVKRLNYPLPFEYILHGDGSPLNGYYDDLVHQVYTGVYDAVVGDVTVTANRSKYVDFTQPYSEAGLVMTVRVKEMKASTWSFLQPFSLIMWIMTLLLLLFTGIVLVILDIPQAITLKQMLWVSFLPLFNAYEKPLKGGWAKIVLMFWSFVVMVLVASYTASLSSILTLRTKLPQVQSVENLANRRLPIGYHRGSFVEAYLRQQLGVDKSLLVGVTSRAEYAEALDKGPRNGGVAAMFIDRALSHNMLGKLGCGKYAEVGQIHRTSGFSFVFPKGSPLVSDMSKAVLNLSESSDIQTLRNKWFGKMQCKEEENSSDSYRIDIQSLGGIFLITIIVSFVAILCHICKLVYTLTPRPDPNEPFGVRLTRFISFAMKAEVADANPANPPPP